MGDKIVSKGRVGRGAMSWVMLQLDSSASVTVAKKYRSEKR